MADASPGPPLTAFARRYSCLYTRDLHKKAKAWHDGYVTLHHYNSKLVLRDDRFVVLDETFHTPPGLAQRDLPRSTYLRGGLNINTTKYIIEVLEAVLDEETDISELHVKHKRKAAVLDEILGETEAGSSDAKVQVRPEQVPRRFNSLHIAFGAPTSVESLHERDRDPFQSPSSSRQRLYSGTAGSAHRWATPVRQTPLLAHSSSRKHAQTACEASENITLATPGAKHKVIKAPAFVTPFKTPVRRDDDAASPAAPLSMMSTNGSTSKRKTLGTSRPASSLARHVLQAEWAQVAGSPETVQAVQAANSGKRLHRLGGGRGDGRAGGGWNARTSGTQSPERKRRMLEELSKQQEEVEYVRVEPVRREGVAEDDSDWILD